MKGKQTVRSGMTAAEISYCFDSMKRIAAASAGGFCLVFFAAVVFWR